MINIENYNLIKPDSIEIIKSKKIMYDITVKDDHTFYVYVNNETKILSHNCDGQHISALIISFFHKWFPYIIEEHRLFRIITPLVVCDIGKERKYYHSLEEFMEYASINKVTNVKYLKGLGSLSLKDWEYVMDHKTLFSIIDDRSANRFIDIAFGDSSLQRKIWLAGK